MIGKLLKAIFGSKNDRELKRMAKVVRQINAFEETISALSDDELQTQTPKLQQRYREGETLNQLLPEAFATVREAAKRSLAMRHFDVQLIGGMALHQGRIAEMRTGEGKTLVATLAAYLNAISGDGVHIVTVNEYLATRDSQWMAPLFKALGLTVGVIKSMQDPSEKCEAYAADITYGTNNEFGFDYLRDNMALRSEDRVQRSLNFAIVDEVDSILIDEARTPLIISGAAEDSSQLYKTVNRLIPKLKARPLPDAVRNEKIQVSKVLLQREEGQEPELVSTVHALSEAQSKGLHLVQVNTNKQPLCQLLPSGDFAIDEKSRHVELTEDGHALVESLLAKEGLLAENDSLYSASNLGLLHHIYSAMKAHLLFHKDVEYIIQNNQVVLIDEHTGRTMPGRRLSEGLHQAIEAKEGVNIQSESQTLASTTFQNYFRLYPKLSGMTGTADTEAFEFNHIYGLDVMVIPTNMPVARKDLNDLIYLNTEDKLEAIVEDVKACIEKQAPVLVGTASVETSEIMSRHLKKAGVKHAVLNAKYHEKEAEIIAQAGRPGVVTIATNMAGRGTDIVLGGNWEAEIAALENPTEKQIIQIKEDWKKRHETVIEAGGLHIIGTERHESRRIDNQLRGRAGRQGDPGMSRFYLSLEDNLMRIFASERVRNFMQALGMDKGEAIEHRMVTNSIETAQRKVEGRNFDYRKSLLEFDDVANDQRQVIYGQRNELLEVEDIGETIAAIRDDVVQDIISQFIAPQSIEEQWDVSGLEQHLSSEFGVDLTIQTWLDADDQLHEENLREKISAAMTEVYEQKSQRIGKVMQSLEKQIMLDRLDTLWKEHLANMDHLRQGIGLRAYAQRNPKQEYKKESFALFEELLDNLKHEVVRLLYRVEPLTEEQMEEIRRQQQAAAERQKLTMEHAQVSAMGAEGSEVEEPAATPFIRQGRKIGRNEPCYCGSGKKYKACHGKLV